MVNKTVVGYPWGIKFAYILSIQYDPTSVLVKNTAGQFNGLNRGTNLP